MTDNILILPHLGLGDQLIMNGYINYLFKVNNVDLIYLVCRSIHKGTIEHLYKEYIEDNKLYVICMDCNNTEIHHLKNREFNSDIIYNNILFKIHSFGTESNNMTFLSNYFWVDSFYIQASCNPSIRKDFFHFPKDLELSKYNYNLLMKLLNNKDYIIISDDPSRNLILDYNMTKKIIIDNKNLELPIIYLGIDRYKYPLIDGLNNIVITTNIIFTSEYIYPYENNIIFSNTENTINYNSLFNLYDILKNCKEAHFMDSSISILCDNIHNKKGTYYIHNYVRGISPNNLYGDDWVHI